MGQWLHSHRGLADEGAGRFDFPSQLGVLRRIDFGKSSGQHCQRSPAGLESRAMGGSINATCQATDDRVSLVRQTCRQALGHPPSIGSALSRADNSHCFGILRDQRPLHVKEMRRIENLRQRFRVFRRPQAIKVDLVASDHVRFSRHVNVSQRLMKIVS